MMRTRDPKRSRGRGGRGRPGNRRNGEVDDQRLGYQLSHDLIDDLGLVPWDIRMVSRLSSPIMLVN